MPEVTAVVLNWCGEEDTAACIRSLLGSDYPRLRILLVDNASPDGSGERLRTRFPELEHLSTERNLGYTGGNNVGLEHALSSGTDYVLILNNDTLVEADCVSKLVESAVAFPEAGAVGGKILYHDAPERTWFAGGALSHTRVLGVHLREGELDSNPLGGEVEEVSFLTGCCLLLSARALSRVGGFAEDFFAYGEDVDLSLRLNASGYRLLYQPGARVLHRVSVDGTPPSAFQIFHRDRNRRRLVRHHFSRLARVRFAVFFFPTRLMHIARYLLCADRDRALAVWRGMTVP
jgi:GT2 family glycosyltransferase